MNEDKKLQNLFQEINFNGGEWSCKYSCGFITQNYTEIYEHMHSDCPTKIIKCPNTYCDCLCEFGQLEAHQAVCESLEIECPFCEEEIFFKVKDRIMDHFLEYHQITAQQFRYNIGGMMK